MKIDPDYVPAELERKQVFGITFEQGRNNFKIDEELLKILLLKIRSSPDSAKRDLIVALITLKYTQSNSVCYAVDGQAIGVGAGQQSRIHCTGSPATRQTFGICASMKRYSPYRFSTRWRVPTAITRLTFTSPTTIVTSFATATGGAFQRAAEALP